jgi:tetratricopeptide (TPR) repeat protein
VGGTAGGSGPEDTPFSGSLLEFDGRLADPGSKPEDLDRMLDRLGRKAAGVEQGLSVLKRRRALAKKAPRFLPAYREAALKAADDFPFSRPVSALAAAALIQGSSITGETREKLEKYLPPVSESPYGPLVLGARILMGDLRKAEGGPPYLEELLEECLPLLRTTLPADETEELLIDLAALKILGGDARGAGALIMGAEEGSRSPEFLRFAAEYYYDFGDPLRAAEIYSRLRSEQDLIRGADALWLSGYGEAARNIWIILISPGENPVSPAITARSLYNLAASGADAREWLERLYGMAQAGQNIPPEIIRAGIIRYARLLPAPESTAVLEPFAGDPLLDLELLRQRENFQPPERMISETWSLLSRHPDSGDLYRWAAWYFDFQRKYGESAMLIQTAERRGITDPVLDLHRALNSIESGNLDAAEDILRGIPPENAVWQVHANLGRVLEARRSPAGALEQYELAAGAAGTGAEKAALQLRIAYCLASLGRPDESRRALEYARDLDPENLNVRLELSPLKQF